MDFITQLAQRWCWACRYGVTENPGGAEHDHIAAGLRELLEQAERIATMPCNLTTEQKAGRPPRTCHAWCHATVAAALAALSLEGTNILKTVTSEWDHSVAVGEVPCHSRMIEGVLCRWWGTDEPPGVAVIDKAALRGGGTE